MRVLIAVALAVAVALLAAWLQRRRPGSPVTTSHHVPTAVARTDFARPEAAWLVAVFTSATCSSCAAVAADAAALVAEDVVVHEVEVAADAELHRRYGIDAVPTTVLCDAEGAVRRSFLGPVTRSELEDALQDLRG